MHVRDICMFFPSWAWSAWSGPQEHLVTLGMSRGHCFYWRRKQGRAHGWFSTRSHCAVFFLLSSCIFGSFVIQKVSLDSQASIMFATTGSRDANCSLRYSQAAGGQVTERRGRSTQAMDGLPNRVVHILHNYVINVHQLGISHIFNSGKNCGVNHKQRISHKVKAKIACKAVTLWFRINPHPPSLWVPLLLLLF